MIPKTIHTTPPDEDYVAPATKSILDDLLEEFRDEILNIAMVDEGAEWAFQAGLVGCYFGDDDELSKRLDVARGRVGCWRLGAWLRV
ncbi:hypothetical protein Tco_0475015 [Tanacetum coccineum]